MDPDIAYANAAFIDGAADYPPRWARLAAAFRDQIAGAGRLQANLSYGPDRRQLFDLFHPEGAPRGLMMFIHGGYWLAFGKDDWSHLAAGALARGFAVAMPSYRLAPDVRIADITRDAAAALDAAARRVSGPIAISGHSAGGHLVARLNCNDVALSIDAAARLSRILPISPLSDLRPLMQTQMNRDLRLDAAEAAAESPLLHDARRGVETRVWVGAEERPAFLDQTRWLAEAWGEARLHIAPGRHHFDVIDGLADAESPMTAALLDRL